MKRILQNVISLLLAVAAAGSVLTESAFAKSDKSNLSGKAGKEVSSVVEDVFSSITLEQVKEIALGHAWLDRADAVFTKDKLDKAVYKLKFSGPEAEYEYEISAVDGSILCCKMKTKESHGEPAVPASDLVPSYEAAICQRTCAKSPWTPLVCVRSPLRM